MHILLLFRQDSASFKCCSFTEKEKNRKGSNYFAEKSNGADQKAHQGADNDMFEKIKSNNYKS